MTIRPLTRPKPRAVTLIESAVGLGVFLLVSVSLFQAYRAAYQAVRLSRISQVAVGIGNERLEIARNLPYADVGTTSGLPSGKLPSTLTAYRSGLTFTVTTTVRNVDDPFDGTIGGSPNDLSPADYKLVEVEVACTTCVGFNSSRFTTRVAPQGLESASTNGALFVHVIDANGQPVPQAQVHIENLSAVPPISIDDLTNNDGDLQLVDAPPGAGVWRVVATKAGYSTEQTYPVGGGGNPNPSKPNATVAQRTVTDLTLLIDRTSTLNVASVTNACGAVGNIDFSLMGAKLIGTGPDLPKYSQNLVTGALGTLALGAMEWDSYALSVTDGSYDLAGSVPLLPLALAPNTTQNLQLIMAAKNPQSLMVTVKDSGTQLPLTDASVRLQRSGYDETLVTGRGFLTQTNWVGGAGQSDFSDPTRYASDDGNVEVSAPAGEIRLKDFGAGYVPSGTLTSSTFDTGSTSNFYHLYWLPGDQPPAAGADSLRFQIATNNDNATWTYLGPDGTASTYYSASNTNINAVHDGDRYLRYRSFLTTENASSTPSVSDFSFTFTSSCTPPGQVLFTGLGSGSYDLTVTRAGYQDFSDAVSVSGDWQATDASMIPN